jgi:hypothetical protein
VDQVKRGNGGNVAASLFMFLHQWYLEHFKASIYGLVETSTQIQWIFKLISTVPSSSSSSTV